MAGVHGGEFVETTEGAHPSGFRKLGPCETVETTMSQRPPLSPSFHISDSPELHVPTHPPSFHIANIQNLTGDGPFVKKIEKIRFLQDQCEEENPYFLGFAETCLKNCIKEAEIEIKGYSHVTSNRINRDGGGVIVCKK